jgi:hypothetical protein
MTTRNRDIKAGHRHTSSFRVGWRQDAGGRPVRKDQGEPSRPVAVADDGSLIQPTPSRRLGAPPRRREGFIETGNSLTR